LLNIQPALDPQLWTAIENNYQSGNFTGAIQDSIYFLSQLIRDRSGLDGDGAALISAALGGETPKLRINNLQTDSEKSTQKGILQMLVGFYLAVRNPRMHSKHTDSSDEAEAIILFVNYLVKVIDRSKSPFELGEYLERVFDASFSESDRYAELIAAEIPERKRWETFLAVYGNKESRGKHWTKLRYFMRALLKLLSDDETTSVCAVVSQELKTTHSETAILRILQIMPEDYWLRYGELGRIRTESKFIASIKDGRYDRDTGKCTAGVLGTWAMNLEKDFELKDQLTSVLLSKLRSSDSGEQDYVIEFFLGRFPTFISRPMGALQFVLQSALKSGDIRFYSKMSYLSSVPWESDEEWRKVLGKAYDEFKEKDVEPPAIDEDDVPF
jgi:uncharacterized protein (TIGR02391 family)